MDTSIIFALCLAVLFLGAIIWLIVHARRQEREQTKGDIAPTGTDRTAEPNK